MIQSTLSSIRCFDDAAECMPVVLFWHEHAPMALSGSTEIRAWRKNPQQSLGVLAENGFLLLEDGETTAHLLANMVREGDQEAADILGALIKIREAVDTRDPEVNAQLIRVAKYIWQNDLVSDDGVEALARQYP